MELMIKLYHSLSSDLQEMIQLTVKSKGCDRSAWNDYESDRNTGMIKTLEN